MKINVLPPRFSVENSEATARGSSSSRHIPAGEFTGRIVVVIRDALSAAFICEAARALGPGAEVVCFHAAQPALARLRENPGQLGIFGMNLPDLDGLDFVHHVVEERLVWRVLIVAERNDERLLHSLRALRPDGLFVDEANDHTKLNEMIRCLALGGRYVSDALPVVRAAGGPALHQLFTPHEQLVFAVIGDGCDDETATATLRLSINTVRWHRQRIMGKLGVQSRGELVRAAIMRGVIRITGERILRPGFERALAELTARRCSTLAAGA